MWRCFIRSDIKLKYDTSLLHGNFKGDAGTGATHDDNVVDADFEVKDDK